LSKCTGLCNLLAHLDDYNFEMYRYGTVCGAISMGLMIGMIVYGTVAANASFETAYTLCVGLGLVTFALTFVFVKGDTSKPDANPPALLSRKPHESSAPCWDVVSAINPMAVFRSCYRVLTKRREGHGATILCLAVLACAPLTCAAFEGKTRHFQKRCKKNSCFIHLTTKSKFWLLEMF